MARAGCCRGRLRAGRSANSAESCQPGNVDVEHACAVADNRELGTTSEQMAGACAIPRSYSHGTALARVEGIKLASLAIMKSTTFQHDPSLDDVREAQRAECVALGYSWAEEKAERYRQRVSVAEWPDFWDDADDGRLPLELDSSSVELMRHTANRAARERWIELLTDQRSSEGDEGDEQFEPGAASRLARVRESLDPASKAEPWATSPASEGSGEAGEAVLVNWQL
jgi:hypothetical protein